MATAIDYLISGEPDEAKNAIRNAAATEGYGIDIEPSGRWNVNRGSKAATAFLGALAGKNQRFVFGLYFYDQNGQLLARLMRETGAGAMGGALGVGRANNAFAELDKAIGSALTERGSLVSVSRQD